VKALVRGRGVRGPAIREFEERFAAYHGVRHAIATSYGRMAFYYILRALDLPRGSEILIPALTF
jgi:perosamine synthetase